MMKNEHICENSKVPKYKQLINHIISDIQEGKLKYGDKLPSINETSEELYLARDTVERAYKKLREMGVILPVRGKGYYINSVDSLEKIKVLLIFNKLSNYKKIIYQSIIETLGDKASVHLHIHHYDTGIFHNILSENLGNYHFYVIIPHFKDLSQETFQLINKIPKDRLVLLDRNLEQLQGDYISVYQDFQNDIFEALSQGIDLLKKYKKLIFVLPEENEKKALNIQGGFKKFCGLTKMKHDIIEHSEFCDVEKGEAYISMEETDLVSIIKFSKKKGLKIGKDIGVLSFNDTPLKEVLEDGISVISTNFARMGSLAAELILEKRRLKVRNEFLFIRRKSL
jgi:DNA-binding transcriptional regulator YhcF (GntR family)